MTPDQATALLLNVTVAAMAEILERHGLFKKEVFAQIVENVGTTGDDDTLREAASILAATIRTGGAPRLHVIDGGKPPPEH